MSDESKVAPGTVSGYEAYRSDEFKAFCKRFGIPWDLRTREITLKFTEELLAVSQEYLAVELEKTIDDVVDTTTLQNDKYRTFRPARGEGVVN